MMNRITLYASFLSLAVIFTACDDIFEKDISAETPEIIAPADGQSLSGTDLTFWWDYMNGADFYQLQISRPGFDLIEKLIADTVIETNKFSITLVSGIYEWRIRACNSAYCTVFLSRTLTVTGN